MAAIHAHLTCALLDPVAPNQGPIALRGRHGVQGADNLMAAIQAAATDAEMCRVADSGSE